jgi:hypothetical protein
MDDDSLDANAVATLARAAGIPIADQAMAERIAAGATAAIAAVRGQVSSTLFEHEPADYLALLERLAR